MRPESRRSSSVLTMPWPKSSIHRRLTNARDVIGLSRDVIHWARSRRLKRSFGSAFALSGGSDAGVTGMTISPESSSQLPRGNTRIRARRRRHGDERLRHRLHDRVLRLLEFAEPLLQVLIGAILART